MLKGYSRQGLGGAYGMLEIKPGHHMQGKCPIALAPYGLTLKFIQTHIYVYIYIYAYVYTQIDVSNFCTYISIS